MFAFFALRGLLVVAALFGLMVIGEAGGAEYWVEEFKVAVLQVPSDESVTPSHKVSHEARPIVRQTPAHLGDSDASKAAALKNENIVNSAECDQYSVALIDAGSGVPANARTLALLNLY